ncbi:MAG: glucoamylase family protein, partial [Gemmatimonadota bacterium]
MCIPFLPGIQRSVRRRLRLGPVDPRSRVALDPIRGEILGHDQLPVRARDLARADLLDTSGRAGASILGRLAENERILTEAYRSLIKAVRRDEAVSPAAEWLLDNFHLVEEQIREARESLPRGYQKQLPRLRGGEHDGEFRVFGLAWEYVAHTDSRFDPATVEAFVEAYQAVVPLSMGELWAIPSAIRLVLVENLRRLAQSIVEARNARVEADEVADAVREVAEAQAEAAGGPEGGAPSASTTDKRPLAGPASRLLADPSTAALAPLRPYDRLDVQRDRAFVVELIYRLRQDDPRGMPAVKWLDERLTRAGVMSEELVRQEHASQVAAQATVANIVTSLRMIAAFDWAEFFEDVSLVERILRREDSGVYPQADFATRDGYRHAVEELARGSGESEDDVARRAVAMAGRSAHRGGRPDERARYLGYHLLFDGRREFEKALGYRRPLGSRLRRAMVAGPYPRYFGALVLLILVLLTLLLWYPLGAGVAAWKVALLGLAALVPASELAIAALHQDVTELVPPRRLPKLELAQGVPEDLATLVAVPVLLGSPKDIARQVERLEERYLANPEGHVAFALLTDWQDADAEHEPRDEDLLGAAAAALLDLNTRYGPRRDGRSRFLLLHRRRVWSERERRWMGWDRKRGKLMELNRLLRGRTDTTYLLRDDGLTDLPPAVRFVITLDSDTLLPPGAARRLIGAAAHPLNRPRFDEAKGRVTAGYGILQPRVTALLPEAGESSQYHRLFAGPTGIDPYSSASSDVYQDLFGEGTFVGKGIYDVDAFQASLEGRIPEGALLSHDHFEGAFARSGLVTDIEVFDDFPTSDEENARRIHRWARGDWQLLPWLIGRAPPVEGRDVPPRPPFLARWKMFDNLRRTLASPSSLLLLVIGWLVLPLSPWLWSIFVVATIGVPVAVPVVLEIWPRHGRRWRSHVRSTLLEASRSAARVGLAVAFLPRRAWLMVDAIFRTLWRMYVTGRNLQEWMPAAQAGRGLGRGIAGSFRRLAPPALTASLVVVGIAAAARPAALPPALVLAAIWAASPLLSWWLSRPLPEGQLEAFSEDEALELRRTARESWRFFERFVTAEDNWLPPDNYQEDPDPRIAHRTSPTNVGLYLLSVVSARDLGWIGTSEAAERIERTMNAVEGLERFRGHLLNWYDTRSLAPLPPRYVSTVDSGNLAGHLLAMAEACREFRKSQVAPAAAAAGIADAVRLVRHAVGAGAGRSTAAAATGAVEGSLRRVEGGLADPPAEADEAWAARLRDLFAAATELERAAKAAAGDAEVFVESAAAPSADRSLLYWARAVRRTIEAHLADLEMAAGERAELARSLAEVAARADKLAREMDFTLLYDPARKLLSIGYRPEDDRLDESYYDLLASEARVASLVAIATGDIKIEHWFHLGRGVTRIDNGAALVSWSGSMFEYLMPYLIMGAPPGTLLAQTRRLVVERQMEYGKERGVPWGVSESAYNGRDLELTYQYSYFGVPGLGLARGLSEELVIAPYATALAAMVSPRDAVRNLRRLDAMGARGEYGFYESVDFSPARLPAEGDHAIVRAHMAHHQGMTVTA